MKRWHNIELKISRRVFVESNWANVVATLDFVAAGWRRL
jgi:hypothetical protein